MWASLSVPAGHRLPCRAAGKRSAQNLTPFSFPQAFPRASLAGLRRRSWPLRRGLENRSPGSTGTVGSNPTPSARTPRSSLHERDLGLSAGRVRRPSRGPTQANRTLPLTVFFPPAFPRARRSSLFVRAWPLLVFLVRANASQLVSRADRLPSPVAIDCLAAPQRRVWLGVAVDRLGIPAVAVVDAAHQHETVDEIRACGADVNRASTPPSRHRTEHRTDTPAPWACGGELVFEVGRAGYISFSDIVIR
jgi:hypothetical protein